MDDIKMGWVFIWQDEGLNMAYEMYFGDTKDEARALFEADHPDTFAFAVIGGKDFEVEEFHA